MDYQIHGFAHERIAGEVLAEQIIAVDAESASGGDAAGRPRKFEKLHLPAERIEAVRVGIIRDKDGGRGRSNMRIAAQVMIGKWIMPAQCAVIAAEGVAPTIAHTPLLCPTGGGF